MPFALCPVLQRSEEERQQAREYAAAMHVNIDYQERARRVTLGLGLMVSMVAVRQPGHYCSTVPLVYVTR